jgi:hypothetical protein
MYTSATARFRSIATASSNECVRLPWAGRNWLFVANVESGQRAALLMSNVRSAKRHSLDVWKYLKDVLDWVLAGDTDYSRMMPDVWKQEHPEAVRVYREEESRYKADRKQVTRARRIVAAKLKRKKSLRTHLTQHPPCGVRLLLSSVPFSLAYSRFSDAVM